jgi:hypothetical protein
MNAVFCKAYAQENDLNIVTKGKYLTITIPKRSRFISLYVLLIGG